MVPPEYRNAVLVAAALMTLALILLLARLFGLRSTTRIMAVVAGVLWVSFFAVCAVIEFSPLSSKHRSTEFSIDMKTSWGPYYVTNAESLWQTGLAIAAAMTGIGWVCLIPLGQRTQTIGERHPDGPG
jgi:hypothetical protein